MGQYPPQVGVARKGEKNLQYQVYKNYTVVLSMFKYPLHDHSRPNSKTEKKDLKMTSFCDQAAQQ